jgi:catechol 2,3-dioxygenase-like lactoylglutathione lyase family enzyme
MSERATDMTGGDIDPRPPAWLGHVVVNVGDVDRSAAFYAALGLRFLNQADGIRIFELRGGTHLVVQRSAPDAVAPAGFDLMVDDLDATHAAWAALGLTVSPIRRGVIHDRFDVTDPDGNPILVNSTHVVGPV